LSLAPVPPRSLAGSAASLLNNNNNHNNINGPVGTSNNNSPPGSGFHEALDQLRRDLMLELRAEIGRAKSEIIDGTILECSVLNPN